MAARTTTTKPAPKVVSLDDDEFDFDSWDQEKEDEALRELNDVKYIIVEQTFVGRFSDGTIVKIPLTLSSGMIDELERDFENPIDQFKHLLRVFVSEDIAEGLGERSLVPVAVLTEKFFRCLKRAQELAFPES